MQQTNNYGLNQWEMTDRIRMEDFNQDNQKIETALEEVKQLCNCQVYLHTYTGTGTNGPLTFTFPHKPMCILILSTDTIAVATRAHSHGFCFYNNNYKAFPSTSFSDRTVVYATGGWNANASCNSEGRTYGIMALLDANG